MNQTKLTISWKNPANRGAVLSILGLSLIIQSIAIFHAILIHNIGKSIEEIVFLLVIAILMGIILAVFILTGYEYLNERQKEVKYRSFSGMGAFILVVFVIAYLGGFELMKIYAPDISATPEDLIFLISEITGVLGVFAVFLAYKFYFIAKENLTL